MVWAPALRIYSLTRLESIIRLFLTQLIVHLPCLNKFPISNTWFTLVEHVAASTSLLDVAKQGLYNTLKKLLYFPLISIKNMFNISPWSCRVQTNIWFCQSNLISLRVNGKQFTEIKAEINRGKNQSKVNQCCQRCFHSDYI